MERSPAAKHRLPIRHGSKIRIRASGFTNNIRLLFIAMTIDKDDQQGIALPYIIYMHNIHIYIINICYGFALKNI